MKLSQLRKIASEQKIKYYCKYSKKDLSKILNLDTENDVCIPRQENFKRPPRKIKVENLTTGETVICGSKYKCGLLLKKNTGSIYHFISTGNILKIDGESFKLKYLWVKMFLLYVW